MILGLYVLFLLVVFALILLGYAFEIQPLSLSGFVILFLLGNVLMFSNIQIKTGEFEAYSYSGNLTANISTSYTYGNVADTELVGGVRIHHISGFLLCLIGAFGFIDTLFRLRGLKG